MALLSRYLDDVGDNTGNKQFIHDYSSGGSGLLKPAAGQVFVLTRMLVFIRDDKKFKDDGYGGLNALTTGMNLHVKNADGVITDLTDNLPIKRHAEWAALCYDSQPITPKTWSARYTFERAGKPIRLSGDEGEYLSLSFTGNNFEGLLDHRFMVQGTRK